jgi:hypothetical protein
MGPPQSGGVAAAPARDPERADLTLWGRRLYGPNKPRMAKAWPTARRRSALGVRLYRRLGWGLLLDAALERRAAHTTAAVTSSPTSAPANQWPAARICTTYEAGLF